MSTLLDSLLGGLNYVGETLGKPGAAVRGMLAGRPDQLLNLIPFSDAMGVTRPEERTSGRDLLRQYGLVDQEDGIGNFLGGMGAEILTDPLTIFGGKLASKGLEGAKWLGGRFGVGAAGAAADARLAKYAGQAANAAGDAGAGAANLAMPRISPSGALEAATEAGASLPTNRSALADLLGKRRMFDTIEVNPRYNEIAKIRGGTTSSLGDWTPAASGADHMAAAKTMLEDMASTPGLQGTYFPQYKSLAHRTGDTVTNRHETVHGLVDAARRSGNTAGIPMIAKPAAWVGQGLDPMTATGPRAATAALLDEMAAHTLENRGLANQLKGFGGFMFGNPFKPSSFERNAYANMFSGLSPTVGGIYRGMRYVPHAAGAGAAGAGGYSLYNALTGE